MLAMCLSGCTGGHVADLSGALGSEQMAQVIDLLGQTGGWRQAAIDRVCGGHFAQFRQGRCLGGVERCEWPVAAGTVRLRAIGGENEGVR